MALSFCIVMVRSNGLEKRKRIIIIIIIIVIIITIIIRRRRKSDVSKYHVYAPTA